MAGVNKLKKYERLSKEMTDMIKSGVFGPGAAIPSVRQLSLQKKLSVTTVLQAYNLLESQGLIEARPRSGYYVSTNLPSAPPEPMVSTPELDPTKVSIRDLLSRIILHDALNPDLIHLGAAFLPREISATRQLNRIICSVIRKMGDAAGLYDMPPGCLELRTQISRRSVAAGYSLSPQNYVITNGCAEAVSLCLRAVCGPGETVAIESPACFDVLQCLESLGLKALEIPTHPQEGISLDALRFALDNNKIAACLASPNFSNPLGSCMSDESKKGLVELLAESGVPLIENDIFGELHFGDKRPLAAKAFDRHDNVLLCSSVSKCLAPGFRVGWVAAGKLQSRIEWLKYSSSMANTTHTSHAVAEFMASGGYLRHLRRIRRILNRNLNAMRGAVIRYFPSDIQVTRPAGGFLLWVRLPGKVDSLMFYKQALKRGIAITPGYIYSPTDRFRNFVRLNTAFWSDETEDAVRRLGRLTAEMS